MPLAAIVWVQRESEPSRLPVGVRMESMNQECRRGRRWLGLVLVLVGLPVVAIAGTNGPGRSVPGQRLDFGRLLPGFAVREIPPGEFVMGSRPDEKGRGEDELEHEVTLDRLFFMSETEITCRQWRFIMGMPNPHQPDVPIELEGQTPVAFVQWSEAMEFCWRLTEWTKRLRLFPGESFVWSLPTEAQWEHACRAGSTGAFGIDPAAASDSWATNAWGLREMHGGVMEWCLDWYAPYLPESVVAPTGPEMGTYRVARGGSSRQLATSRRSASRARFRPEVRNAMVGFRPVLTLESGLIRTLARKRLGRGLEEQLRRREDQVRLGAQEDQDWWSRFKLPGVPKAGHRREFGKSGECLIAARWIPAGTFDMGSPENEMGRGSDEYRHAVTLSRGFWMSERECSQAQWKAVMGALPGGDASVVATSELPVESIHWDQATEFCRRLTNRFRKLGWMREDEEWRLPTEAEWEYACRAGSTAPHHGLLGKVGWFRENADGGAQPMGTREANRWGLVDMHGNVAEWCSDWYDPCEGEDLDPTGPITGRFRVIRGGAWMTSATYCRAGSRAAGASSDGGKGCGFRVVLARVRP